MITIENLSYKASNSLFGRKKAVVLDKISLTISNNRVTAIIGQSGSGKTTLVKIIAGLLEPTSGKISFENEHTLNTNSFTRILFQNSRHLLNPNRRVKSILNNTLKLFKKNESEAEIQKIFSTLQINDELVNKYAYQLSGGELQRAALANLLVSRPKMLILDEPFSAQDKSAQKKMGRILHWVKDDLDLTMIIVSHKISILEGICDEFILLDSGKIIETGTLTNLFHSPKTEFTKNLLKAEKFDLK